MNIVQNLSNKANYSNTPRKTSDIKYLVIHYTASEGSSINQGKYFHNNVVGASAHLFVGHKGEPIIQSVPDNYTAWSVGTAGGSYTQKHPTCRNSNSISIELCCWKKGNDWVVDDETIEKALELVESLMKKYNIPKKNVLTHWQVVNKKCPIFWVDEERWKKEFWNKIGAKETTKTTTSTPAKPSIITGKVKTSGGTLRLRKTASSIGKVLGKIPNGKTVTILEKGKTWHKVQYGEAIGYVAGKYIEI